MGRPNWFCYSAVPSSLEQIFEATVSLRHRHRFKPRDIARLGWDEELEEFGFLRDTVIPVREDGEVLERAQDWEGFAISYNVLSIRATIYLYFWKKADVACLGVQVDDQVPYVEVPGMAEGEWLERFVCEYTHVIRAAECANGWNWGFSLNPLENGQLVTELREGKLLTRPLPALYLVAEDSLSREEMDGLLAGQPRSQRLRYFYFPGGYHVLSSLCRSDWAG